MRGLSLDLTHLTRKQPRLHVSVRHQLRIRLQRRVIRGLRRSQRLSPHRSPRPIKPEDINKRLRCTLDIRVTVQRRRPGGRAPERVVLQPHPRGRVVGAGRELDQTTRRHLTRETRHRSDLARAARVNGVANTTLTHDA